ncbi:linear amide C-N hydrolase [Francisella noatunensis]
MKRISCSPTLFGDTVQPKRDLNKPGVNGFNWVNYVLGNYSTVEEVLENLDQYQIYVPTVKMNGEDVTFQFTI